MSGHPSAADLIEAVESFLRQVEQRLQGREAFHAKVAANALAIAVRELRQDPASVEAASLAALLGADAGGALPELRREACARLRDGRLDAATPGLVDALTAATIAKLEVDNPRYATLERLRRE